MINYIIGIGAFLVVVLVGINFIHSAKTGKGSCGCDCKSCKSDSNCKIDKH